MVFGGFEVLDAKNGDESIRENPEELSDAGGVVIDVVCDQLNMRRLKQM